MKYDDIALELIKEITGAEIELSDVGSESYSFEVVELDPALMPKEYAKTLVNYTEVLSHLYVYGSVIVYVITPLKKSEGNDILIGVLEEGELVNYSLLNSNW